LDIRKTSARPQAASASAHTSTQPVVHAKRLEDGSLLLYVSKRGQGTGLKNFLFKSNARRAERARQALESLSAGTALAKDGVTRVKVHMEGVPSLPHIQGLHQPGAALHRLRFLLHPSFQSARAAFGEKYQRHAELNFIEAYWDFKSSPSEEKAQAIFTRFFDRAANGVEDGDGIDDFLNPDAKAAKHDYLNLDRGHEVAIEQKLRAYRAADNDAKRAVADEFVSMLETRAWPLVEKGIVDSYENFVERFNEAGGPVELPAPELLARPTPVSSSVTDPLATSPRDDALLTLKPMEKPATPPKGAPGDLLDLDDLLPK
jgi:hypothetical protein